MKSHRSRPIDFKVKLDSMKHIHIGVFNGYQSKSRIPALAANLLTETGFGNCFRCRENVMFNFGNAAGVVLVLMPCFHIALKSARNVFIPLGIPVICTHIP